MQLTAWHAALCHLACPSHFGTLLAPRPPHPLAYRLVSYINPARNKELVDRLAAKKVTVVGGWGRHAVRGGAPAAMCLRAHALLDGPGNRRGGGGGWLCTDCKVSRHSAAHERCRWQRERWIWNVGCPSCVMRGTPATPGHERRLIVHLSTPPSASLPSRYHPTGAPCAAGHGLHPAPAEPRPDVRLPVLHGQHRGLQVR